MVYLVSEVLKFVSEWGFWLFITNTDMFLCECWGIYFVRETCMTNLLYKTMEVLQLTPWYLVFFNTIMEFRPYKRIHNFCIWCILQPCFEAFLLWNVRIFMCKVCLSHSWLIYLFHCYCNVALLWFLSFFLYLFVINIPGCLMNSCNIVQNLFVCALMLYDSVEQYGNASFH